MSNKKSTVKSMQVIVSLLLYYVYMNAIRKVIKEGSVTKDLYTLLVKERGNGKLLSTSEFTKKLIASL